MKDLLLIFSSERKLVRDSLLVVTALAAITYAGGQGVIQLVKAMTPQDVQRMAASDTSDPRLGKTYTVVRSVLDEQITTGSIQSLNTVRLDPCKK